MKTKFGAIVNLRKNDMQRIERSIMQNENKIASKQSQIAALQEEFLGLKMPSGGAFYAFRAFEETKNMLLAHIALHCAELESLQANKALLQEQYKKSHIEYEKVKFLEKKEQDSMLQKLKEQERLESDEIALMLYSNAGGRAI
ncbi:flagellar export protein FliJ [Helicobacter labetoulli]|uniref:flagellar export protein FliJ n=1 Tax=Helicobacter labetoulli TaxID=2315333 RepID=UPI000EF658AF|nr:flagellar export protein FliJ [Helicobacter labetoulli]